MNLNDLKNFFGLHEKSFVPNVGIGTTTPGKSLHIYGASPVIKIERTAANDEMMIFKADSSNRWSNINFRSSYDDSVIGTFAGYEGHPGKPHAVVMQAGTAAFYVTGIEGAAGNRNKFGFDVSAPTKNIALSGEANITLGMENESTAADAGRSLTINAGGSGTNNNLSGGNLILTSGPATGDGGSEIQFQTVSPLQGSGGTVRSPATKMVIQGSGVGIGTTTAAYPLTILGANNAFGSGGGQVLIMDTTAYNASPVAGMLFRMPYKSDGSVTSMGSITVGKENTVDNDTSGYLALHTRGSAGNIVERLRISSSGNVGIGSATPTQKLNLGISDSILIGTATSGMQMGVNSIMQNQGNAGITVAAGSTTGNLLLRGGSSAGGTVEITDAGNNTKLLVNTNTGNVGIGTSTPGTNTKLRVEGQISAKSGTNTNGAIDFAQGNAITSSYDCTGSPTLDNIRDGGSYTVVMTNTGTAKCDFSVNVGGTDDNGTVTYRYNPANGLRTASSHTVYSMLRVGNIIYVSWISGF